MSIRGSAAAWVAKSPARWKAGAPHEDAARGHTWVHTPSLGESSSDKSREISHYKLEAGQREKDERY